LNRTNASSLSAKVSLIAIVAVLYAVGKGVVAFIPSPWGVGSLYIGVFIPAYFAIVSDYYAVAIGAALGTFIGDSLFLTALNTTNPALSLVSGVPANFVAFFLLLRSSYSAGSSGGIHRGRHSLQRQSRL